MRGSGRLPPITCTESRPLNDAACVIRHDRPAHARGGIIPETLLDFHVRADYLSNPYQKTGFVVLCRRIALSVMAGFLNKFILLLPQRRNIAQVKTEFSKSIGPALKNTILYSKFSYFSYRLLIYQSKVKISTLISKFS